MTPSAPDRRRRADPIAGRALAAVLLSITLVGTAGAIDSLSGGATGTAVAAAPLAVTVHPSPHRLTDSSPPQRLADSSPRCTLPGPRDRRPDGSSTVDRSSSGPAGTTIVLRGRSADD